MLNRLYNIIRSGFDINIFTPKLFTTLKNYSQAQFLKDITAGVIVGIVALPLAIAFAIASGVSPEKGLFTAIVAGFIISALGGSRVQIGGPTGAFIVIVYGIVQQYGVEGLTIATFIAGLMLIIMGFARLGSVIRFIPYPLIVGFTSGIPLIIFSSQMKDFFGLSMGAVPSDFIDKWMAYGGHLASINYYAVIIAVITIVLTQYFGKITHRLPGSLVAILCCTIAVHFFHLPVETIGSKFGAIPAMLPAPHFPMINFAVVQHLIKPAFTIALLGAIESLLSAVVADGMIGGNHKSNMELVAQGVANMASSVFGGIPATGAIARTATNVKNGGRTPIAGMVHATTLLVIMLFAGKYAAYIPMASLAGILVVVAYNMSEYKSFLGMLRGPKSDIAVLLTTFLLTVFADLTVAIEVGMVLASFLFMNRMIQLTDVEFLTKDMSDTEALESFKSRSEEFSRLPKGVEVFEIRGPFFFGAAYKFKESMRFIEKPPNALIAKMKSVPVIDATGIHALEEVYKQSMQNGTTLILTELQPNILAKMKAFGFVEKIGEENVCPLYTDAITRAEQVVSAT
jgi:SulP family sulfate permease